MRIATVLGHNTIGKGLISGGLLKGKQRFEAKVYRRQSFNLSADIEDKWLQGLYIHTASLQGLLFTVIS